MEYHTYDSRLNVSDLIRWFITCFDDSDQDALSTHAGMGDVCSSHVGEGKIRAVILQQYGSYSIGRVYIK
jgi:hypothetical protein